MLLLRSLCRSLGYAMSKSVVPVVTAGGALAGITMADNTGTVARVGHRGGMVDIGAHAR
jgi:hypothetical protein